MELEPIEPQTAVELYLTDREAEVRPATLKGHRSRLNKFVEWCEKEEIHNLNGLTGRQLHQFRIWRRDDGNLAPPSEKSQMDTLRVFIRWLGTIDGVDPDLHHKVRSPAYNRGEHAREVMIDSERA
jgi:site-specific recombinase XerD